METIFIFLVHASVYLLLTAVGYYFLISSHGNNTFKRFYILTSFILSLGLACIGKISMVLLPVKDGSLFTTMLPGVLITAQSGIGKLEDGLYTMGKNHMLFMILLFVAILCLLRFGVMLWKIFSLAHKYPVERMGGLKLVIIDSKYSPFSFFHWIFIPEILRTSSHLPKVIAHEKAHHHLGHSWDIVLMELLRLIFWFHPVWYLFKKEIQTLHEYQADRFVLQDFSRADYQSALLDFSAGTYNLPVTNPFNLSIIKKRFIMMNKVQNYSNKDLLIRLSMILPALAIVFFLQTLQLNAQEVNPQGKATTNNENLQDENVIFTVVEAMPEFPGGQNKMMDYLVQNLTYPPKARAEKTQGTVFVNFIVEEDGKITNVKVLRGVSEELDQEAVRVVKAMPAWTPGQQRGKAVKVQYTLPLKFALE